MNIYAFNTSTSSIILVPTILSEFYLSYILQVLTVHEY